MAERSKEVLSVIEDDVKWLNDAARLFETLAHKFGEAEKSKWNLLATVYLERAKIHQELAISLRGDAQLMKVDIARKRADDCEDDGGRYIRPPS